MKKYILYIIVDSIVLLLMIFLSSFVLIVSIKEEEWMLVIGVILTICLLIIIPIHFCFLQIKKNFKLYKNSRPVKILYIVKRSLKD